MNAYYRVELPLRELERRGHAVLWPDRFPPRETLRPPCRLDVLMMHHHFGDEMLELVGRLRREGVAVVWDTDDDISVTPKSSPAYRDHGRRRGLRAGFASCVAIAGVANAMTTPSTRLAERFRAEGVDHVEVIENYVAQEDLGGPRRRHAGVVIGMTAGREHVDDIRTLGLDKTLRSIMDAHPQVRVVSFGVDHDLPWERHTNRRNVPVTELIAAEREFDIGLAPLVDSPFNRARSNVKLKEYAAAGAMWLASPVGPYRDMGEEQGGLLVGDRDWGRALHELIDDYRRRAELTARARAWARSQTMTAAAGRWDTLVRRAVERARVA